MKKRFLTITMAIIIMAGCSCVLPNKERVVAESQELAVMAASPLVFVDGKSIEIQSYNVGGYNFFKLRDLAMALRGTFKEVGVDYNSEKRTILVSKGQPYEPIGGELNFSAVETPVTVVPSVDLFRVDGINADVSAYNIDGYNYFKLRDLGKALDFGVSWDAATRRVVIETNKSYQDSWQQESFGIQAYGHVEYFQENLANRLSGTSLERETEAYILSEIKKSGFDDRRIGKQPFTYVKQDGLTYQSRNLILTIAGQGNQEIIVGAHYDSINSHGVDDNGSGVAVLLETAARLVDKELPFTVRFVFFGAEENGIFGSPVFVNSLTAEEKKNILLMVNLDSILAGDRPYIIGGDYQKNGQVTQTWAAERAKKTADELGLEMFLDTELEPRHLLLMSDQGPFREAGIPYVFFLAGNLDYYPEDPYRQTKELGVIMNSPQDDLALINRTFPGRAEDRLSAYSRLLYHFLLEMEGPQS